MAIVNRSLDASEQRTELTAQYQAVGISTVYHIGMVPYASTLDRVAVAVKGVSGSPAFNLRVERFITGAGNTIFTGPASASLVVTAVGTSGVQYMTLTTSGSTLLDLQVGDILSLQSVVANGAVTHLSVAAVIKATQDIKTHFGV